MKKTVAELIPLIQDYDFKSTYRVERDPKIKIKLLALHHLQSNKLLIDVADIVLVDEKTVRSWIHSFVSFDYEGLIEKDGRGSKPRLPVEREGDFRHAFDELHKERKGGAVIARDIQQLLATKFDCNYTVNGVYVLLDRLNIVWITARSIYPKHSVEAVESFKEKFPEEMKEIKEKVGDKNIEVWWQDESRIGQQGSLSRVWAEKGTRPRVVRQRQFLSTYLFGAVCPEKDKGCALILPEVNTGMMQLHLDLISQTVDENCHGIIIMDQASWHTTEALVIPSNISLVSLPPYSPELNPLEQVWQNLRKKKLSNTSYKNYEDILDACSDAWNSFVDEEGVIRNLCSRAWARTEGINS